MIWHQPITLDALNHRNKDTLSDFLGIVFTEIGPEYLHARMRITTRHLQPHGIMNGGASCVFAETVGSVAANCCVNPATHYCVGLDINTNHLAPARENEELLAIGTPLHIGKLTQVWSIHIHNPSHKLISVSRLTLISLPKK
jgi:uncharacterized protein (TIGR00369 family)